MSTDRTTEILNYLSAISREVGEIRTDVKSLREEVNSLREEMNTRFGEVNNQFGEVNKRLEKLERGVKIMRLRLDAIEGTFIDLKGDVTELSDRVGILESKQG